MDRKIVLSLTSIVLIVLAIAILIPGGKAPDTQPRLPWDIEIGADGKSTVFGLSLGSSTLDDARKILRDSGSTSLFVNPDNQYHIETYFERMALSGIRASFVLALDVDPATAEAMYKRGVRLKSLESGNKQVTLTDDDVLQLSQAKIDHITYIPVANLDAEMLEGRFGQPKYKLEEQTEVGTIHWLYPEKGLDISLNTEGKEVFQYVNPKDFDRILKPLQEAHQAANNSTSKE
ncbi:MAG: hypothetical protein MI754_15115 [Chromatiales bacterium]|nr:hypothetical protein [Chromatiales bacterium]